VVVEEGGLVVNNGRQSGTGAGPLAVNAGTLGGKGIIAGAVQIGTGTGPGATLAPAHQKAQPHTLTIESSLTFAADGAYNCLLATGTEGSPASDAVVAAGVTITAGASFNLIVQGTGELSQGTSFTILDNTGADPIAGTFANLPDGAILTVNGQHLAASYEGGDGNDLTLTVVP
jgi:hypothetical protein